jgi:hypothetical protein
MGFLTTPGPPDTEHSNAGLMTCMVIPCQANIIVFPIDTEVYSNHLSGWHKWEQHTADLRSNLA